MRTNNRSRLLVFLFACPTAFLSGVVLWATALVRQENANQKLLRAIHSNDVLGVKAALGAGAEANRATALSKQPSNWREYFDIAFRKKKPLADPEFPLIAAVNEGHPRVVRLLLNSGADIDVRDESGETPLDLAFLWGTAIGGCALALSEEERLGIDRPATQKALLDALPLHQAVRLGRVEQVERLLRAGADPNTRDPSGRPCLSFAVEVLSNLQSTSTKFPKPWDPEGQLIAAVGHDAFKLVSARMEMKLLVLKTYHSRIELLKRTLREDYGQIVRALVHAGADPRLPGPSGHTALALAQQGNMHRIVALLMASDRTMN